MSHFFSRNFKLPTLAIALTTVTLISGCATTVSPESRLAYDKNQQALKLKPVSIISDGCLIRVEMGKNDILYQQSDLASLSMMATVEEALSEKGLKISRTTAPFICGSLSKEDLTKVDILITEDAKDELNTAYPILGSTNTFDSVTNQTYLNLLTALDSDKRKAIKASEGKNVDLGLDQSSLNALKNLEGANKVFISMVTGSKPSFGYSMAMGVSTAVVSGGTGFLTPQPGQFHHLYLINLDDNTIEWGKTTGFAGQVFKLPVNERFVYKDMLNPLYDDK